MLPTDVANGLRARLKGIDIASNEAVRSRWSELDQQIQALPEDGQEEAWKLVIGEIRSENVSKGHPYFRLAVLHLLRDADEMKAIEFLEKAYEEDKAHAQLAGREAHRMAAYRVLSLVKGYFRYLAEKRAEKKGWECDQFLGNHRRQQIETLIVTYDASVSHPLDIEGHTYQSFFRLIGDRDLCRFAIENYFSAEALILFLHTEASSSFRQHEYPLSRSIVGMLGGVIEAILVARVQVTGKPTFGAVLNEAISTGFIKSGSRLAALCSLLLYFRNHIHPDRDIHRKEYFIDLNVARGCKAALDWAIREIPGINSSNPATGP
jgi:hypothetical protein